MILAALALFAAQTAPAPAPVAAPLAAPAQAAPEPPEEDIVVTATLGHTTMLFDKGADGKLRNCRVMKSSGSQRRDTEACQSTPVCYGKKDEYTECVDLVVIEPKALAPGNPGIGAPVVFDVPQLAKPKPMPLNALGPSQPEGESKDTERQRVKLPPLPKAPSDGPAVTFTTGKTE